MTGSAGADASLFSTMTEVPSPVSPALDAVKPVPFPNIPFSRFRLSNGLTLIVHEDRSTPLVATQLRFNVGSKDEPLGRFGFAHLFEHLMFKESAHRRGNWHQALTEIGGSNVNGSTSYDFTNYYQTVPTGSLETLLWMESDRMGHLLEGLSPTALAAEIEVVKNEKRQREGAPLGLLPDTIAGTLYPVGHPYGHTILGTVADLDRATLDTVSDWYRQWYGAGNAVLALAGDISPDEALAMVERWFGALPRGAPIRRATRWPASRQGAQRLLVEENVGNDGVVKVWSVPPYGDPDTIDLSFLAYALTGAPDAQLTRRLVHDEDLCVAVEASVEGRYLCSEFCVSATFSPGADSARIEAIIHEELARLLTSGPTAATIAESLRGGRIGFIHSTEPFEAKAELLASSQMSFGTPDSYRRLESFAAAATSARVAAAGRRWLDAGEMTIDVRSFVEADTLPSGPDRARPPRPGPVAVPRFPATERGTLSNGISVRLARRPGLSMVTTLLQIDGGTSTDPEGAVGLTAFAIGQLGAGSGAYDREALATRQRQLGCQLTAGTDVESVGVRCHSLLVTNIEATRLMAEFARSPAFAQEEVDRARMRALAVIDHAAPSATNAAARAAAVIAFGPGHMLGRTTSSMRAGISGLTHADLVRQHAALFNPSDATLFVVGDMSMEDALPPLEAAFGDWRASAASAIQNEGVFAPSPGRYLVARAGASQSAIHASVALPALGLAHDIGTAVGVFGHIFGEHFGSRLNRALREERGWTYGAQCGFGRWRGIGNFTITTEVQADRTIDTIEVIAAELRGLLSDRPITEVELEHAKSAILLQSAGIWSTDNSILAALIESRRRDLASDHFDRFGDRLAAVSMDEVAAVAAQVANPDLMTIVVAGDPGTFNGRTLRLVSSDGCLI